MTSIEATKTGNHFRIEANNHAETSRVCSAISALLCTLDGALRNNQEAVAVYSQMEAGHYLIECIVTGDLALEDWQFTVLGLLMIEAQHPEEIQVSQNIFQ